MNKEIINEDAIKSNNKRPVFKQNVVICKECKGYGCTKCDYTGSTLKEHLVYRYASM